MFELEGVSLSANFLIDLLSDVDPVAPRYNAMFQIQSNKLSKKMKRGASCRELSKDLRLGNLTQAVETDLKLMYSHFNSD